MRLTSLLIAFIFDSVLHFKIGSSFFLLFISFIPNNWVIDKVPHLTSLLPSVMLLVCTESITSSASLIFLFSFTLILFRFWGFGKLSFFISSKNFSSMFCLSTVSILPQFINEFAFSSPLTSFSSFCVICCFVNCCIGSVLARFCYSYSASKLFLLLSSTSVVAVVTVYLSFKSFALDHTTFALLLETTPFLSKKHAISILLHLADFDSCMSLRKYYLIIRLKLVKKSSMPNPVKCLGYIKCYNSSILISVKSPSNSIRNNCRKILELIKKT